MCQDCERRLHALNKVDLAVMDSIVKCTVTRINFHNWPAPISVDWFAALLIGPAGSAFLLSPANSFRHPAGGRWDAPATFRLRTTVRRRYRALSRSFKMPFDEQAIFRGYTMFQSCSSQNGLIACQKIAN